MKNLLIWVFGLVGLITVAGGGFLALKDGGLSSELYSRQQKLHQTVDPESLLKAWGEKVDELASQPVSRDSVGKPGIIENLKQQLPEPGEVRDVVEQGVNKVGQQVDKLIGNGDKPTEQNPEGPDSPVNSR